jgi:iron transport multicopper oxidase
MADGLRGPLVVKDPASPFAGKYSDELVVTVSDWYHDQSPSLIPYYLSPDQNPTGAEPVPYSSLINEAQNVKLEVKPNTTYLVRIISMAAFSQTYVHFDQHDVTIIAVDGIYVEPRKVSTVYVAVAQRYDVLLTTKNSTATNYAFFSNLDQDKFDNIPGFLHPNATGSLVYDASKPVPSEAPAVASYDVIDDFTLVSYDGQKLLKGKPDTSIVLNLDFFKRDGQNRYVVLLFLATGAPGLGTDILSLEPALITSLTSGKKCHRFSRL